MFFYLLFDLGKLSLGNKEAPFMAAPPCFYFIFA